MFIGKDGDDFSGPPKNFHNPFHQLVPRIEFLAAFVARVVAVLADKADRVHGQIVTAKCERLPHRRKDPESMFFGKAAAQIGRRNLVRVHRNHPRARLREDSVGRISIEQPADNHVGVRVKPAIVRIHRHDGGDRFLPSLRRIWEAAAAPSPPASIWRRFIIIDSILHGQSRSFAVAVPPST